jgi:DNA polymerase III epsilon subunit-like protein
MVGNSTTATDGVPKKKKAKGTGDLALKTLLKKYLATDIQTKGNKGHDSLEDATAARDLVHWMVSNVPLRTVCKTNPDFQLSYLGYAHTTGEGR